MSNPTTPFGWQMPTATDLVTDLPADFEVFGQAVATSMADLLGGTTGQVLSKTSNTDMDFTWTSPNPGDITGVTAGVGISGGGTSGDVTVTNSMATAITTNGDIIYGTGSGTFSRLGIGSTNQVLKVTAGIPSWGTAGGGNLTETTFTSSNASWTIPSGVTGIWALIVGGGGGGGASTASGSNCGGGGGAGQVVEKYFAISGDTTLNITVGAGGAGATTSGGTGSNGSTSSIVGNTSTTTYVSGAGGGGGGGGGNQGNVGASAGGDSRTTAGSGGAGGGAGEAATNTAWGIVAGSWSSLTVGGGNYSTIPSITGGYGGTTGVYFGGIGLNIWNRALASGGHSIGGSTTFNAAYYYGTASMNAANSNAGSATANTGSGGNGAGTTTGTKYNGGNGGSGLVVLRYVS